MKIKALTVGVPPHVFHVPTTSHAMWIVSACLLVPILQSAGTDGFRSLIIAAITVGTALGMEFFLCAGSDTRSYTDGSAVASALILCLILPNNINLFMPFIGTIFGIVVVKKSFGGLGSNWINPAAGAWLFLRFSWPETFDTALKGSALSMLSSSVSKGMSDPGGSPLALLKVSGWKPGNVDAIITSWLNDTILIPLGAELPGAYTDFMHSSLPALIIDRGVLGFLLISVLLLSSGIVRWILPFVYLVFYIVAVRIWGALPYGGQLFGGDMLFSLLSGSTLLGAFIFAGNPATGTKTRTGTVILAAFAGFLAYWFRFRGGDAYGLIPSITVVNVLAIIARRIEHRSLYSLGRKR